MRDCFIICRQFTSSFYLIFHQNTHQSADLHTSVLVLHVYVSIVHAGVLMFHARVLILHVSVLNYSMLN